MYCIKYIINYKANKLLILFKNICAINNIGINKTLFFK